MNNNRPLNQMINELKPEEYADFVNCLKENFNAFGEKRYKLLEPILRKEENKVYFDSLTVGCQIAMMLYIEAYEMHMTRQDQISEAMRWLSD